MKPQRTLRKFRSSPEERIDFLIEGQTNLELKTVDALHSISEARWLSYLRANGKRVGLLMNFHIKRLKEGIPRFII